MATFIQSLSLENQKCRDRSGYWTTTTFSHLTCASCYGYLFPKDKELKPAGHRLISTKGIVFQNLSFVVPDIHNETIHKLICDTLELEECYRWTQCCLSAEQCCDMMRTQVSEEHCTASSVLFIDSVLPQCGTVL